jgi:zinc transporter ZupT
MKWIYKNASLSGNYDHSTKGERIQDYHVLRRVLCGVLIGDFFHNFTDGIFIGAAFNSCDSARGWTVATTSIFHEMTQEIADFIALRSAGLSVTNALLYNFASGISVLLGGGECRIDLVIDLI